MKSPNTRFTRIETTVLVQLRAFCKARGAVQSELVSKAVGEYLKRAVRKHGRSKTSTPNPRKK